jgi:hypothetical protein
MPRRELLNCFKTFCPRYDHKCWITFDSQVLANSSVEVRYRVLLAYSRALLACNDAEAALEAIELIQQVPSRREQLTLLSQRARTHNSLGNIEERDRIAQEFSLLHQSIE